MNDWREVYSDQLEHRIDIVVAVLSDQNIQAVKINKQDTSYQLGLFEVHVAAENVIRALKIIKDDIQFE